MLKEKEVTFLGKTFINDGKSRKSSSLAVALLQGQLSYPTFVFMVRENGNSTYHLCRVQEAKRWEVLLSIFADRHTNPEMDDFQKNFIGKVQ